MARLGHLGRQCGGRTALVVEIALAALACSGVAVGYRLYRQPDWPQGALIGDLVGVERQAGVRFPPRFPTGRGLLLRRLSRLRRASRQTTRTARPGGGWRRGRDHHRWQSRSYVPWRPEAARAVVSRSGGPVEAGRHDGARHRAGHLPLLGLVVLRRRGAGRDDSVRALVVCAMRGTVFVHIAVMAAGWCSLLCAAFVRVCLGFTLQPGDIVRYHLIGPPDQLFAVRWVPPLLTASALCALFSAALAVRGMALWSSRRASRSDQGER